MNCPLCSSSNIHRTNPEQCICRDCLNVFESKQTETAVHLSSTKKKKTQLFKPKTKAEWGIAALIGFISLVILLNIKMLLTPDPKAQEIGENADNIREMLDCMDQAQTVAEKDLCFDSTETAAPRNNLSTRSHDSGITMAKYNQISTGMSYAEVRQILGEGQEMSRNELAGYVTVMYMWQSTNGANMNVMLQNDAVIQKAQFGLK